MNTGKVEEYSEELSTEWTFVDPSFSNEDEEAPAAIRMGAVRSIKIEKVD